MNGSTGNPRPEVIAGIVCSDVPKTKGVGLGLVLFCFLYGAIYSYEGCIPNGVFI